MSTILTDFYSQVKQCINISEVVRTKINLTKKGQEYLGLCPFHNEKTPSFTVNDSKKFYHCFGCGEHGDVIKFVAENFGYSYRDAAYKLAKDYNIALPQFSAEKTAEIETSERVLSVLQQVSNFFESRLNPEIKALLYQRGLSDLNIKRYNIGYTGKRRELINFFKNKGVSFTDLILAGVIGKNATDEEMYEIFRNRIIIPIKNNFGKITGFGGRALGDALPKYLNSPETLVFKKGESLFGEDFATSAAYKNNRIILVEGFFDVITLQTNGFAETVASQGTAITIEQLQKLWKIADEIIICLDGDEAGMKANFKVINNALPLLSPKYKISFIILPNKLDPDELIRNQGVNKFTDLFNRRMQLSEYLWNIYTKNKVITTPESRAALEQQLTNYTENVKDKILQRHLQKFFKDQLWELGRQKKSTKSLIVPISSSLVPTLNIEKLINTETENLEEAMLAVIIQHLNELEEEKIFNILDKIAANNSKLEKLIEFFYEIPDNHRRDYSKLVNSIQNSNFNEIFEIILNKYRKSILSSLQTCSSNIILEYLVAKHCLIQLTLEYREVMKSNDENTLSKIDFYITEIKHIQTQIESFNQNYILTK